MRAVMSLMLMAESRLQSALSRLMPSSLPLRR